MKLSDKEATILAAAELRSNAPIQVLRKESGYREHTVRYALRSLRQRNVICPVPFINLHKLGYTIYTILFSTAAERKGAKDSVLKSFISAPDVLWVGEFGGEFQYGIAYVTKSFPSLVKFLHDLSLKHQTVFFEKAISIQISSTVFPRKYLSAKKFSVEPVTVTFGKTTVEADDLDGRILGGLTTYSDLSHRQIALKLQIPLSTLELRLKKLRDQGVIAADIYSVDASAFDRESFKLLVYTKGLDPQLSANMHKFCSGQKDVTTLIECLGSWGFEIGVEVTKGEAVTSIIQDLYDNFSGSIHTIKLLTKFRYPKVRWFPDLKS